MLTISYHLVQSIFEVLHTHRSKTLDTSDGKEMGLSDSLYNRVAFVTLRASSTDWTSLTVSVNSDVSVEFGAVAALPDEEGRGEVSWAKTDAK